MAFTIDASDPLIVFGALAALIFLGFAGNFIFSKLRFNDTLILILVGVIVGPIAGWMEPDPLLALSGIIGPLALILILFDGGLALKFRDLSTGLGSAAVLGILGFIFTTAILGGLTSFMLGTSFTTGMVLGSILGGTSALVVLPSLEHMNVEKRVGTTLGLESALTDVLVVVVSFTLIAIAAANVDPTLLGDENPIDDDMDGLPDDWERQNFAGLQQNGTEDPDGDGRNNTQEWQDGTDPLRHDSPRRGGLAVDAQSITSKLLITFAMSVFIGISAGFLWLFLYPNLREKPFGYMLTLGFMFAMYVFVEWILRDVSSGGGPLAVLAFGVILGNNESLGAMGRRVGDAFGSGMKRFQGEISFLVRTFFFVFLGIIVDLEMLKDPKIIGISLLLLLGMLVARYLAVVFTCRQLIPRGDNQILIVMMPRGLAAAVLAAVPAATVIPGTNHVGIPGTESFVALAFLLLVWTNLLSTIGGLWFEKHGPIQVGKDQGPTTVVETTTRTTKTTAGGKKGKASSTQSALEGMGRKKK